jgi:hypothetical protein
VIAFWLDEEWAPLEVHGRLGEAAGEAYVTCRLDETQAVEDYGDLVLQLASTLDTFPDYKDTFVNNFDVANKVVEILMLRQGVDVCCTDADMLIRFERSVSS